MYVKEESEQAERDKALLAERMRKLREWTAEHADKRHPNDDGTCGDKVQ
jgi:hypothetical protein